MSSLSSRFMLFLSRILYSKGGLSCSSLVRTKILYGSNTLCFCRKGLLQVSPDLILFFLSMSLFDS